MIEAKAWDRPATEGVGQAKHYAAKRGVRHAYATKGQAIYGIDMATGAEDQQAIASRIDALADKLERLKGLRAPSAPPTTN